MRLVKFLSAAGLAFSVVFLVAGPVQAQAAKKGAKKSAAAKKENDGEETKKKKRESADLEVQGTIGALAKGSTDIYDFTYIDTEGKKPAKKKAWLKIDSSSTLLADRALPDMSTFKENDAIMIFAKPFELETGGRGGGPSGKDRRLQAARVVIGGKKVEVNEEYKDPKDDKFVWCEATIEKAGPSPNVNYSGASYKATLDKGAAVIKRDDGDPKKDLRRNARIYVQASKGDEKPAGEKEDRPVFKASQVLVMAPSCLQWYAVALLPK
jgi:hypothetical protein